MKFLKSFQQINELVSNKKLISSYMNDIKQDILQINPDAHIYIDINNISGAVPNPTCEISLLKKEDISQVERVLLAWKEKLLKIGIVLAAHQNDAAPLGTHIQWVFKMKDLMTKRVKPNRFIFHWTKSSDSVLASGLRPRSLSQSEDWSNEMLDYPPAIFACNSYEPFKQWGRGKCIMIDTKGLKNKWWYDLNFPVGDVAIMTFEFIPKEHLHLIDNFSKISNLWKSLKGDKEQLEKEIEKLIY